MCGIVGYIGNKNKALNVLIDGLQALEYRGYDSAGVAFLYEGKINIKKEQGRIKNLKMKLDLQTNSYLGIGHTRWATHGAPNKTNSHPHNVGKFTIVHNGIIENYIELKQMLIKQNYKFKSDTDTEVACATIDYIYKKEKNILKTFSKANKMLRGSYALGIICNDDLNTLYAIRKTSPLIIASGNDENFIASDVPAILKYTNKYILLDDNEIAKIKTNSVTVYDNNLKEITKQIKTFEGSMESGMKNGYEHYMLKEINEQDRVIKDTINHYFDGSIESLNKNFPDLSKYNRIHIVACGSAYHTGMVGKYLIEKFANIPVDVEIASEYRYKNCFYDKNTLVILVSQSGETADTLASLKKVKNEGIDTLAIVNVVGSSIAREAKYVLYIKAGCEIAVATTKAYLAQISIFSLLSIYLGYSKNIIDDKMINEIVAEINKLPEIIKNTISNKSYIEIAKKIYKHKDIFFIGRGIDYALCMEGSLKLKEISYINSVAYAAGELKHGTISLIEKNTPVIAISTDDELTEKTISNIKEVKARGANVIYLTNQDIESDFYNYKIVIDKSNPILQSIITIIPLQLLAYEVAKLNGCDIDKPRNLAKSVTVE